MADVAEDVLAIIANKIPGGGKEVNLGDKLMDLGLESVDFLEMVFDLEEKFDIEVPYNANTAEEDFATVGDVVKAIQGLVEKKA
jgi:acyl carrier protein